MKKFTYLAWIVFFVLNTTLGYADWGKTGHQIIAEVAESRLTKKAKKKIGQLLSGASMAEVSTYADEIKYNPMYRKYASWHYVNLKRTQRYQESKKNPKGDLIQAIQRCIVEIKNPHNTKEEKAFYLKLLIHFVGDIHQPMHVGRAADKGGNNIRLQWFGKQSNLHRIWDSQIIDHTPKKLSEWIADLPRWRKAKENQIARMPLMQWAAESQDYAHLIYAGVLGKKTLGQLYYADHITGVKYQLLKGGIRLAQLLNELFA